MTSVFCFHQARCGKSLAALPSHQGHKKKMLDRGNRANHSFPLDPFGQTRDRRGPFSPGKNKVDLAGKITGHPDHRHFPLVAALDGREGVHDSHFPFIFGQFSNLVTAVFVDFDPNLNPEIFPFPPVFHHQDRQRIDGRVQTDRNGG
jgi:hypothetical protein